MWKLEYVEKEKSFLDKTKSIFYNYLRAIIRWKSEKQGYRFDIFYFLLGNSESYKR